jgi:hypothetical protein
MIIKAQSKIINFMFRNYAHQRPILQRKIGTIIDIIKINSFILINYLSPVKKLGNGLNGRLFKLSEDIFIVGLIKINFFTPYNYIYLIIKIRFKIGEY